MSFSPGNAIHAYTQTNASGAMAQSPHGLIAMLFEGAILAVAAARTNLQLGMVQKKCESISKAISIIEDGLYASLDQDSGGDLSLQLANLYEYMVMRLIEANSHNNASPLEEVGNLLSQLASAWSSIASKASSDQSAINA